MFLLTHALTVSALLHTTPRNAAPTLVKQTALNGAAAPAVKFSQLAARISASASIILPSVVSAEDASYYMTQADQDYQSVFLGIIGLIVFLGPITGIQMARTAISAAIDDDDEL